MALLEIKNLTKIYETNITALQGINLSLDKGEFKILLGPSGAGKTTLFKLINLEEKPSSGEIIFDQFESNKIKRTEIQLWRRKIGVIFQDLKLLKDRTVFENLALMQRILGKKEKEIKSKTMEILSLVGLATKRNFLAEKLAQGEKQKLAVARACVHNPVLILADEPTGHLDKETAKEILNILLNFNKSGSSLLLATNQMELTAEISSNIIKIKEGRLVQ